MNIEQRILWDAYHELQHATQNTFRAYILQLEGLKAEFYKRQAEERLTAAALALGFDLVKRTDKSEAA